MNDNRQGNDSGRNLGPVIGFAVGALVGGILGVLLAPASGETTRRRIAETTRRVGRNARRSIDEARETLTDAAANLGTDVKSALDAGREAFDRRGEERESRPVSRIPPRTDASATHTP